MSEACSVVERIAGVPGVYVTIVSKDGLPLCTSGGREEFAEGAAAWAAENLAKTSLATRTEDGSVWLAVKYGDVELTLIAKPEAAAAFAVPLIRLAAGRPVKCSRCGADLTLEVVKCPVCGRPMPFASDRCPNCGVAVPVKRCPRCGAKIESTGRPPRGRGGLLSRLLGRD